MEASKLILNNIRRFSDRVDAFMLVEGIFEIESKYLIRNTDGVNVDPIYKVGTTEAVIDFMNKEIEGSQKVDVKCILGSIIKDISYNEV